MVLWSTVVLEQLDQGEQSVALKLFISRCDWKIGSSSTADNEKEDGLNKKEKRRVLKTQKHEDAPAQGASARLLQRPFNIHIAYHRRLLDKYAEYDTELGILETHHQCRCCALPISEVRTSVLTVL